MILRLTAVVTSDKSGLRARCFRIIRQGSLTSSVPSPCCNHFDLVDHLDDAINFGNGFLGDLLVIETGEAASKVGRAALVALTEKHVEC